VGVEKLLENNLTPEISNRINDIMASVLVIKQTPGLTNLTESMKTALTTGIQELITIISLESYSYFQVHDFEPTPEIIPVLRGVVQVALSKGVI
jgi:hypothetical protein